MRSPIILIIVGILLLLLGVYLYRYLLRIVDVLGKDRKSKRMRFLVVVITLLVFLACFKFLGYGLVILMHVLVISWILDGIHFVIKRFYKKYSETSKWNKLYKSGVFSLLLTSLVLCYGYFNMQNVIETNYEVYTEKTIRQEGYTIAMVSDLHYPTTMKGEALSSYAQEISKKNPDFVVLCGDIVDESTSKEEMEEALHIFGQINNKYGIYYVYGNHDYARYSGKTNFTRDELYNCLNSNKIQILEDSVITVNNEIVIIGRADSGYGNDDARADQEKLLDGVDSNKYLLLLDHKPKELKENAALGIDLQLSGHTHAGQLWPAGTIGELLGANEQNYGIRENGSFTSIVSSGIAGWGNKLRTAKHSEYVIIELRPKN